MSRMLRRPLTALLLVVAALTVTGCSGAVSLDPAADANDPLCAAVTVRLPDTVSDDLQKRETTAQATGAWGDPAAVLLHCGVDTPGPTTLPCFSIDGVDWIRDDSQAPVYTFTTYGRTPAVEVTIDSDQASGSAVIDLSSAVSVIPQDAQCLNAEDVTSVPDVGTASPTPTPTDG